MGWLDRKEQHSFRHQKRSKRSLWCFWSKQLAFGSGSSPGQVGADADLANTILVVDEIQLLGSRCGRFDVALEWLASGALDPRPWIAARFPLSQVELALAEAGRGGVLKVLLDITPA